MDKLTPVEIEILQLLADGKTQPEIAFIRGKSVQTVKNQASAVREKLGAQNIAQAVAIAFERGILQKGYGQIT